MTAWLPVYWISFYSVTPILAGMLAGVFSIVTSLVRVGGGTFPTASAGDHGDRCIGHHGGRAILMTLSGISPFRCREILMAIGWGGQRGRLQTGCPGDPEAVGGAAGGGRTRRVRGFAIRRSWDHRAGAGTEGYANGFVSSSVWRCSPFFSSGSSNGNAPWCRRPRFKGFALHGFLRS